MDFESLLDIGDYNVSHPVVVPCAYRTYRYYNTGRSCKGRSCQGQGQEAASMFDVPRN